MKALTSQTYYIVDYLEKEFRELAIILKIEYHRLKFQPEWGEFIKIKLTASHNEIIIFNKTWDKIKLAIESTDKEK